MAGRVFVTGDTHGAHSMCKLSSRNFPQGRELDRSDYVVILGDFGLVWAIEPDGEERWWLQWLESKPWTTLFVDGNHENFDRLYAMPVARWHGGTVHRVSEHIIHLMRAQVFDIAGRRFFTMGGAHSIDRAYRTEGRSWWPQEVPDADERAAAFGAVERVKEVDYVLTHAAPTRALLGPLAAHCFEPDEWTNWLDANIAEALAFRRWLFGHYHADIPNSKPYTPLYDEIVEL